MDLALNSNLCNLWDANNKDVKVYLSLSYNTILVIILEILVKYMNKNIDNKRQIKSRLLAGSNKIRTIKNIVYEYTKYVISDSEANVIYDYLLAYFRKYETRKSYELELKEEIIIRQNCTCNSCQSKITLFNSELDHIIPWSLVGDELGIKNLQLLCSDCNRNKSNSVTFNLKNYLLRI